MEQIGVTAIIEGLSTFISGMDKIQSSIEKIKPPASILQDAFSALGEVAGNFASFVGDVLTYTLGGLLKDAIEGVISMIGEMISKTIEAGNEFQTLTLRLNGMNLDALIKSGADYNTATTESIKLTQEQLGWLQKLAASTPYDNTDISQVYSLARSYGFADEEARKLTENVGNFSSAMGLSGDHMERIIVNLGQMKSRGKITSTELRDLARGAFLPLDDVLGRVAKSMGITTEALTKMISKPGEGVPYQNFITAFEQMINEEPRFVGASERMARTFKAASNNVMDLATSFGGLNIVTPILDVLGGKIADFMDQFVKSGDAGQEFTALGQKLLDASVGIGKALSDIVSDVLGLAPSTESLANGLVSGLQSVATWLTENKEEIVAKIKEIVDWVINLGNPKSDFQTNVIQPMRDLWDALFKVNEQTNTSGFQDLITNVGILGFAIGEVLRPVLKDLGVVIDNNKPSLKNFTDALAAIAGWIYNNRETLQLLLQFFIAFVIVQTATNLIWTFIGGLFATGAAIVTVLAVTGALVIIIGIVIAIVAAVIVIWKLAQVQMQLFTIAIQTGVDLIKGYFTNMENTIRSIMTRIDTAWRNNDWGGIGWAIISGIADGIGRNVGLVIDAAKEAAMSAYNAALDALGIQSPSKLFAGIGENVMAGMAQGITDSMGLAVGAMNNAVAAVTMPALSAPAVTQQYMSAAPSAISNTYQSNNSYNLSIHSQAQTEQVGSDFALMQSLAGI